MTGDEFVYIIQKKIIVLSKSLLKAIRRNDILCTESTQIMDYGPKSQISKLSLVIYFQNFSFCENKRLLPNVSNS